MGSDKSVRLVQMIGTVLLVLEKKGVDVRLDENEVRDLAKAVFGFCLMSEDSLRDDVQAWLKREISVSE